MRSSSAQTRSDRMEDRSPEEEAEALAERERGWVASAQAGDREAFDRLVIAYQDRIFNLVYRMVSDSEEAADLTQEAFVKAYRALDKFRLDARFSTWLYRIAVNTCLSRHRKTAVRKKHAPVSLDAPLRGEDLAPDPPDTRSEPARVTARHETTRLVQDAIGALEDEFRTVVLLRDIEGYSYEQIADIVGCPVGTVRSRLHRARAELGRRLRRVLPAG